MEPRGPRDGPQSDRARRRWTRAGASRDSVRAADRARTDHHAVRCARARQSAEIIAAGIGGIPVSRGSATVGSPIRALGRDGVRRSDRGPRLHPLSRASAGHADARRRDDRAGAIARRRGSPPRDRRQQRPAHPVRLARRHHPHRPLPFHAARTCALPPHPRGQRGVLWLSSRRRFRRNEIPEPACPIRLARSSRRLSRKSASRPDAATPTKQETTLCGSSNSRSVVL